MLINQTNKKKYWEMREKYDGKDGINFTGIITQKEIADILCKASCLYTLPYFLKLLVFPLLKQLIIMFSYWL